MGTLVDPCFAGRRGPAAHPAYPVDEIRNAGEVLIIQPPVGLPAGSRHPLQIERDALEARSRSAWTGRLDHQWQVKRATDELRRFASKAAVDRRRLLDVQLRARAAIGDTTHEDLTAAAAGLSRARADADGAEAQRGRAQEESYRLRRAADAARSRGLPSDDDRRLVERSTALELPAKHTPLREHLLVNVANRSRP